MNGMIIRADRYCEMEEPPKKAKLRIGRVYDGVIGSHCVKPIHDLSVADPFAEMTKYAMCEFGHYNLWRHASVFY